MKTYGVSRTTTAPPERVWKLWSNPNNWSRWNSGIASAQLGGPIADGARGKMTTNHRSTHDVIFSNVSEGRGFSMSMAGMPGATFTFNCEITPQGTGSKIAQSVTFAGPLAFLVGPLMGNEMAKHFIPVLNDLAKAAES
ncbi:MAG: SRPBCC family protein [Candidatus Cybelea sp.]|jgi:uncharacterized protein YndB with AHSA1/START domain